MFPKDCTFLTNSKNDILHKFLLIIPSTAYCTQDSEEEAACDYLDAHKGCILTQEDKPFDCKIWPLRIMRKGDRLVIALTPTCPSIGREPSEELKELVNNGLGEVIYNYAKENPFIIKEYKEGFPIIMG